MPVNKTAIAFKVELKRRDGESTFHRFSGAYNYSELSTVISHLWGERPKHLVLDYTDDEGDQVRFTTEAEWEECVRIHLSSAATVLRLTGKKVKEPKVRKDTKKNRAVAEADAPSASESDSEQEVVNLADVTVVDDAHLERNQAPTSTDNRTGSWVSSVPVLPEIVQELKKPLNLEPLSQMATDLLQATMFRAPSSAPSPTSQPASANNRAATPPTAASVPASASKSSRAPPQHEAPADTRPHETVFCDVSMNVLNLMSQVYNCDADTHLFQGVTEKFGSVVKRLVNPFAPSEVTIDIDRSKLYRDAVAKGNDLIGALKLDEAEKLLTNAIGVFPSNSILEYNMACVRSMQSRVEEAIDLLVAAKAHGYSDMNQLKTDADLANARKHPRFTEVVPEPVAESSSARPSVTSIVPPTPAAAPVNTTAPVPAPERSVPVAPIDPQVMTLMSIFPDMSIDEATNALKRAQGNLGRAVNSSLSGH